MYVCENPSVLIAAADVIGESSRPLVCTNGRPSVPTLRMLAQLTAGGTTLHVRADDDVSGQEIVAGLRASIPNARLWRYTLRPPDTPRYEEQDLDMLLHDLDRSWASQRGDLKEGGINPVLIDIQLSRQQILLSWRI